MCISGPISIPQGMPGPRTLMGVYPGVGYTRWLDFHSSGYTWKVYLTGRSPPCEIHPVEGTSPFGYHLVVATEEGVRMLLEYFLVLGLQMTDIDLDARVTTLEENDNGKDK